MSYFEKAFTAMLLCDFAVLFWMVYRDRKLIDETHNRRVLQKNWERANSEAETWRAIALSNQAKAGQTKES